MPSSESEHLILAIGMPVWPAAASRVRAFAILLAMAAFLPALLVVACVLHLVAVLLLLLLHPLATLSCLSTYNTTSLLLLAWESMSLNVSIPLRLCRYQLDALFVPLGTLVGAGPPYGTR